MIVNNTEILQVVREIDVEYNKITATHFAVLYSKLAVIEFCGWIEKTLDEIIKEYINNKLALQENKNYIESNIIKQTHGFSYENHFRKMFVNTIGIKNFENLEDDLEPNNASLTQLKAILAL